ncbi:uncharacterized protein LOC116192858 isoform X2 [Punica granatum]|uniref:Uncharacterized protein LOC116192858 isoform X2 n=1 Tax=Punica granatum TaxID=22663 RepID=A0A6P8C1L4_PUNGR|nr:uncharacterized protein LOC116192858 isoform X2 [Punica granatum]
MANPGVGNKFVSVNLNKSYGQQQHHHSGSYSSRTARAPNSHHHGGGGMVVLSRPRSSQKAGPKLSVPPPMNLPSLRKEHEKFDSLGGGGGPTGGGAPGSGLRPSSSGMRWTKPVTLQEKEGLGLPVKGVSDQDMHDGGVDGLSNKGAGSSVRLSIARAGYVAVEKSPVLRGEDFPSLRATLPVASGPSQKLKDGSIYKQKQMASEMVTAASEAREGSNLSSHVDMRPQQMSSPYGFSNGVHENESDNLSLGSSRMLEQSRKQDDYFAGPLPLVRLNPRSDWADDERDTGHGLMDRGKDNGFARSEAYWEGDFDVPKPNFLPHKSGHSSFDRWALRDSDTAKFSSTEVPKAESHGRDVRMPSREGREGNLWRASSPLSKDNVSTHESGTDRNGFTGRPSSRGMEMKKDNRYVQSLFRDGVQNDVGRNGQGGKLPWNNSRERYGSDHSVQNNLTSKASIGVKVPPFNEIGPNKYSKEKRLISKSEKPYAEDPFLKDFGDGWDPVSGNILGVVKRKKDVLKDTDFHDPVRESFEAELERVQKMQEQERQRIIEEQEKALELARREEEERARLAREQEEMQRRLEEEAREAAWRAEQERLEAFRKAEEQRIVREEEKRRIVMEEERRKQAAKQKLLELEERIAKRQADTTLADEKVSDLPKEKDSSRLRETESFVSDGGDWEDTERMVERITTPASSDSSSFNRPFANLSRDSSSSILIDRGKPTNTWRRDRFENGNSSTFGMTEQESSLYGPRRDASFGGKSFARKEFNGGAGFGTSQTYGKGGASELQMDAYSQMRGQRWNLVDGDPFNRNIDVDPEFPENLADKFGDAWEQGRPHANAYSLYPEQYYRHPEADGSYSFGRSRHSMRQPRVPPPPTLASANNNKNTHRGEIERPGPSSFTGDVPYHSTGRREPTIQVDYRSGRQENVEVESVDSVVEPKPGPETAPRCDSQSSLSVSSPPDSPVHLSHDDLDESGEYPVKSAAVEDEDFLMTGKAGQANIMTVTSSVSSGIDDGEWALENSAELQEQEEYDEDEEGYREDEVREGEDENVHLSEEFEGMHLEDKASAHMMDSLLGFNEDVGVRISDNELEISSQKEVSTFPAQAVSAEEKESFERDAQPHLHADGSSQVTLDQQETETGLQAAVIKANDETDDNSRSHALSAHQAAPSSTASLPSQSAGHTLMPSPPAFPTQAEIPVKLQFGLFSGPSLIPTPVPAIQIGSIQMPLHLHPQSLGHPSQPPLFQFGQLRYTSPISPGVVPLATQSMSFLHPSVPANFPLSKNPGGPVSMQSGDVASAQNLDKLNISGGSQQGTVTRPSDLSQGNLPKEANMFPARDKGDSLVMIQQGRIEHPIGDGNNMSKFQAKEQEGNKDVAKNFQSLSSSKEWEGRAQMGTAPPQPGKQEKDFSGSKGHGSMTNSRGKHYVFKVKNVPTKLAFPDSEASQLDGAGHQRRQRRTVKRAEFRIRDNGEKGQSTVFGSVDHLGLGDKSNMNGRNAVGPARSGSRKAIITNKASKHTLESEGRVAVSGNIQELGSGGGAEMGSRKESLIKAQMVQQSRSIEGSSKRDTREEDVEDSLQSGVVRVFKQPGIEAPSDEDDFIEVRSKRQMLNDKREQREKDIKAKSRVSKVSRRSRSSSNTSVSGSLKTTAPRGEGTRSSIRTDFAGTEGHELADFEVSSGFNPTVSSQPLAPIGTPPARSEASADLRSLKTSSLPFASGTGQTFVGGPGLAFTDKNVDDIQTSMDTWASPGSNQPVMALTQSQLDEAMKPANFDSRISVGDHTIASSEHIISSSSMLSKDKQFSSAASPINSLLAGEKIQFVTSPTVLPPSTHLGSHGIGPPGPCQPDIQIPHKIPPKENNCSLFFEKEKNSDESNAHLEDCEAEAEAAASAVAVAAISNDEIIGNGLGNHSLSVSDTKSYGAANADGIAAGVAGDQPSANQSRAEEPLSVSLPADLSVDTPPISLWPPLTPPQATSSQMLSHFPAGSPSHFPFYDMNVNAMMGSPIFAFGPNEDSSAAGQSHAQKSGGPSSGLHATWHHSGVDSFYGGPTGFTGPFIGPGGIPGVQAPPHMVVYNHFAPVGQFGQVGLSFMGTTFIPSGKQPDWKHNPAGPCTTLGEGDVNNMNVVSAQRNAMSMPSPIQHLAPGSPLLPMASPLPMFDVSPFQSSAEVPVHARWSPLPSSTLQSVAMSVPMQQQTEGMLLPLSPQYPNNNNNNALPPVDQSVATNRPADGSRDFPIAATTDSTATQLPDELGLLEDPSGPSSSRPSKQVGAASKRSADSGNTGAQNNNNNQIGNSASAPLSNRPRNSQHYGGSSTSSSSVYSNNYHRRGAGFQGGGRNHSFGVDKGYSSSTSRVKQIYVAKQRNQSATS